MSCSARWPCSKPRNEPLTIAEDKLLQHLASQAGLVFRNGRLTAELQATIEELRASRRRLVEAQDAERRKIERNLHDGAQQQLVALSIQLGLLEQSAEDADSVRQLTPQLRSAARAALDDLRDLARGIYPPLLADQGLVPALQAQARKATVPVLIEADGIGRYPQDAEATVYFCAPGGPAEHRQVRARLPRHGRPLLPGGSLEFSVTDDGAGFDTAQATRRHRPAGHGRPAGRARRHPPYPAPARSRHHRERPAARRRAGRDQAVALSAPRTRSPPRPG